MTKTKEAKAVLYDAAATQSIPLNVTQNGKTFTVRHELEPLTDERYFAFMEQIESAIKRATKVSTDLHIPKEKLWDDLVLSVDGYKPRDDFKNGVHQTHKLESVNALVEVQTVEPPETDTEAEYFDIDAHVTIPFRAMFSGTLLTDLSLSFRAESKAEMNDWLSLEFDQPIEGKLASATKRSKMEKLADLGRKLLVDRSGYLDGSEVPAWHLAPATESFFARQAGQAGKASA